ncbi:MAG: DCL family protein [Acidithiobacillus sp.]
MPAKPISFGDLHFAKRGDAIAFLNAILQKYDVGDKVSADDAKVLLDALSHHPEAKEKIGCGVASFSVRSADFGTKCFWVNRIDGSTEKFSHKACVLA